MSGEAEVASPQPEAVEPAGDKLDAIILGAIEKVEPDESAPTQVSERPRDERGRFVSDNPAEAKPSDEPEPAQAEAKPAAEPPAEPAQAQPIEPPARWSDADKAEFAKLAPEAKQLLLARYNAIEGDYTRKTQELAETRKSVDSLLSLVKRHEPLFQQWRTDPVDMLDRTVTVLTNLNANPVAAAQQIVHLAQHYRADLGVVLQGLGIPVPQVGDNGQMSVDPTVLQLRQELLGLKQSLQDRDQQAALAQRQSAEAEFNALAQQKDASGAPKFPHFERVKDTMIQLVANRKAESWDAAYAKSIRLDDDLYKQTVEAERKLALDEAEKQRLAAVEKAKKAAPVKVSSAMPKGAAQGRGLDNVIDGAIARAGIG